VASGRRSRRRARGGEIVQTLRTARSRLLATFAALTVGAALAAYPLADAGELFLLAASLGALALVALGLALAYDERLLLWALLLVAVEYTLVDLVHTQPLLAAPFYGAGLLLAAELAYAANELRRPPAEAGTRLLARMLTVAGAAFTASFVSVLAAGAAGPGGVGAAVLALAAACGLLALPLLLLRRDGESDRGSAGY
jgi:hypothetical protein